MNEKKNTRLPQRENPIISLLFNIVLPVVILNHGHKILSIGSVLSLLIAISFPVGYGINDYFKNNKHKNPLSIIGTLNVLLSGSFAILQLEGYWFAIKEAFFPFIIGVWFYISSFSRNSLMKWVVYKSFIFQPDVIESKLDNEEKKNIYDQLLKKSTIYFSLCFFLSAVLNFVVAMKIFVLDKAGVILSPVEYQIIINQQIADMTWISFLVIGMPLTIVSGWTLWWFINELKKLTSLKLEEMIRLNH